MKREVLPSLQKAVEAWKADVWYKPKFYKNRCLECDDYTIWGVYKNGKDHYHSCTECAKARMQKYGKNRKLALIAELKADIKKAHPSELEAYHRMLKFIVKQCANRKLKVSYFLPYL